MIDGFKNREVVQERYQSALNDLTQAERNEYLRDGQITVEDVGVYVRREVEERMTTRHETRKYGLEDILGAEFYSMDSTSDGVPFTHFINFDYGLVSVIRFSDGTIHVFCKDERYLSFLKKRLEWSYDIEHFGGFVRFNFLKPVTVEDKIKKITKILAD